MIDTAADLEIIAERLPPHLAQAVSGATRLDGFASSIGEHIVHLFANIWSRPGLGPRDRSLITVAMLVALDKPEELTSHARLALKNGVTREELEELVLHSTVYAGFPAALNARATIREAIGD